MILDQHNPEVDWDDAMAQSTHLTQKNALSAWRQFFSLRAPLLLLPIGGISRLYDQKVSAFGLGLFRATYAVVMLGEVFQLYYFRRLTFSVAEINYGPILLAWMIVVLFLMVGLFTRTAAVINYLLTLSTLSVFVTYEYHHDYARCSSYCNDIGRNPAGSGIASGGHPVGSRKGGGCGEGNCRASRHPGDIPHGLYRNGVGGG